MPAAEQRQVRPDFINSVNLNQGTGFPYLVLDIIDGNSYPRTLGFQVMHWHEDLQFIYVLSGTIEVVTLDTCTVLHTGDGIFINKNVVHLVKKPTVCHYKSFLFPDYFLKFHIGSPAADIVERLVENKNLPIFRVENREEHKAVLDMLQRLSTLVPQDTPLYAYEVLTMLCTLWPELCRIVTLP